MCIISYINILYIKFWVLTELHDLAGGMKNELGCMRVDVVQIVLHSIFDLKADGERNYFPQQHEVQGCRIGCRMT